jgi:outer membrane receptor for ferrienterochelin and colicin
MKPLGVLMLVASAVVVLATGTAAGGTTGILEGTVKDKQTGEAIPGANVFLPSLQIGAATDAEGAFSLQNIRAGRYELRITHVGYRTFVLRNVAINPDLRTRLRIVLEQTDVQIDEVVVVQEKPLIQPDVTSTTFMVSGEELRVLPIDRPFEIVGYKPGTTLEGNIRGGKSTEVNYLIDGLPVQDVLRGGMSSVLPISSLVGMSIYTGGFEAEYGNALSGVVNIITRSGGNDFAYFGRAGSDHLFGGTQDSRQTEFEGSASGPLLHDRLFFVAAGSGILTGTRWWQDMQNFFRVPQDWHLNGFGKVDYVVTPTLRLGFQVLSSYWDWRDYEFSWRFNLDGLPPERKSSNRVALTASQTVGQTFYYTASLSWYNVRSRIGDGEKGSVPINDPYQYDFGLQYVVAGARGWWMDAKQNSYTLKFDGTSRLNAEHLLKFGVEFDQYNLQSDLVKLEPRKTYFGKPLVNEPQLDFSSAYTYAPRTGNAYIQDKMDFLKQGVLFSFGLRYDFLDPRASRPAIETTLSGDTAYIASTGAVTESKFKNQISPRFGAAMPMTERGCLFFNLGWYFQHPLFDYLYTGIDRVALGRGVGAVTGNPDLEPERTTTWEVSFKYIIPLDLVASIAYFKKDVKNLTDTKAFVPGDSKLAGNFGFAEFVNSPWAKVTGCEVVLTRERGEWVTGELSYTYMIAEGTSGNAYDGYYNAQYGLPPSRQVAPLSWDQRHTVKLQTTIARPQDFNLSLFFQWHSGRPYTAYPTPTGFEPVVGGVFQINNERMPSYINIDMRAEKQLSAPWGSFPMKVYFDVRNLTDAKNVSWIDSNGRIGGELHDPSGYFIGRRMHVGLQVDF